jgi:adenosine deaminase
MSSTNDQQPVPRWQPLVDLHCHVDGAARPGTLLELARGAGIALPADTVEELLPHVQVSPGCRSLREFLLTFETFYPVLSVPGAMERVAHELVEDAAADGVVHLEARFCPALQAGESQDAAAVMKHVLAGLESGGRATGISWGAIVCCYRPLSLDVNAELIDLAIAHADRGVVAVDLAGPEDLPGAPFADSIRRAGEAGLGVTIHAGEAAGPESVREALDVLGATRIGHGVALAEDDELRRRVAGDGVVLECCLTSNLQTGAVPSLAEHPFERFRAEGLAVTLNTDDPAVCGVQLSGELALAAKQWDYDDEQLASLGHAAVDAAFIEPERARELHALFAPDA